MARYYGETYAASDRLRAIRSSRTILRFSRSIGELATSPELGYVLAHFGLEANRFEPEIDYSPEGAAILAPHDVEVRGLEDLPRERIPVMAEVLIEMAYRFDNNNNRNDFFFIDHTENPDGEYIAKAQHEF